MLNYLMFLQTGGIQIIKDCSAVNQEFLIYNQTDNSFLKANSKLFTPLMEHSSQQLFRLLDQKTSHSKSSEQMAPAIRALFHSPEILVSKVSQLTDKNMKNSQFQIKLRNRQFDIELIKKIYQNASRLKLEGQIFKCYMKIAQKFQQTGNLQKYVTSQKQMQFFFIVILWQDMFTNDKHSLLMLKMLNLINNCPGYTSKFQSWVNEIDQHYITLMVGELQKYLRMEFEKLPADLLEQSDYSAKLWLNISNMCKFMKILNHSNSEVKRVPKEVFVIRDLEKYFETTVQYKLFYHKRTRFSLLGFPFLMPLDYKYELLKIESILQQKMNIQKSMASGFSGMISAMIQNNDFSLEGLIYLYIEVNRHDILNDSMEKLNKVKNLKAPLRISFVGEQGSDEGGVKNEYFQLITKAIFNPYLDMFLPKHNGRVYWFNGFSYEPPIRFEFVGMLLGLAIYNSVHLHIPFPSILYKKLLDRNEEHEYSPELLNDLHDIEPDIQNGLKKLLQTQESLQDLEVYFTIELQHFGQKVVEELVEDGHQIIVTQDNKQQYCQLYADFLLNKQIKKQFDAFKKGFYKVVSGKMIELLDLEDLKTIIYGNEVIDFKELQQTTSYEGGYTKNTPIIQHFWEILHSLNIDQKKAFLVFATGSDRVPIEGMKELNFVIQRHANTSNLPTAHTCFNVFLLPEYETKQKLQKMIRLILQNNQGFGLI